MKKELEEYRDKTKDALDIAMETSLRKGSSEDTHAPWTFLSNHAHVLVCLDRAPDIRMREIAILVGITERGVHRILTELEQGGVIVKHREGRRNRYEVIRDQPLRHSLERHASVGQLLLALSDPSRK